MAKTKKNEKKEFKSLAEKMKEDKNFLDLCNKAEYEPNKRQYSKYLMKKGLVYKTQVLKVEL